MKTERCRKHQGDRARLGRCEPRPRGSRLRAIGPRVCDPQRFRHARRLETSNRFALLRVLRLTEPRPGIQGAAPSRFTVAPHNETTLPLRNPLRIRSSGFHLLRLIPTKSGYKK